MEIDASRTYISVYVAREGVPKEKLIREQNKPLAMQPVLFREGVKSVSGMLYFRKSKPHPPNWLDFFGDAVDRSRIPDENSVPAVFILEQDNKLFALPFGHGGYHLLDPDSLDQTFGLRVAVSSIGPERIQSFDKKTFDAIHRRSRIQAARAVGAVEFGLDVEKDLVRSITGKPKRPDAFGTTLTGGLGVRSNPKLSPVHLDRYLRRLSRASEDEASMAAFPWLGKITAVNDPETVRLLDGLLEDELRQGPKEKIWLAAPDILNWAGIVGFRFMVGGRQQVAHDVSLEGLRHACREGGKQLDLELLKSTRVEVVKTGGSRQTWSAYNCLNCEFSLSPSRTYFLSDGNWFKINDELIEKVESTLSSIEYFSKYFHEFHEDGSEDSYNHNVAKAHPSEVHCIHGLPHIRHGRGVSKFEWCDLYGSARDLIYVKRYGGSSTLSHLFSQGLVNSGLLAMDEEYRGKALDQLPTAFRWGPPEMRFDKDQFQVVYAIIGPPSDRSRDLPLFSKINLHGFTRQLRAFGFRVALAMIPTSEQTWLMRRPLPTKKAVNAW